MTKTYDVKAGAVDAMEALFDFAEAMQNDVTTAELAEVMKLSIEEGHDQLMIALMMALSALKLSRKL